MDIERRFTPTSEIRLNEEEGKSTLEGLGVVYNSWSEDLGGFIEMVKPGAGLRSVSEDDIFATYNHNDDYVLGRKSAGTMTLDMSNEGIRYKVSLPETTFANDLKVSIGRKDVKGSSFRFIVTEDNWGTMDGKEYREIIDFKLFEMGPVTNPAYPQTTAGVRSALYKLGIDYESLYRAILKSQTDNQEERDVDVIASAIEALQKYLPSPQVDLGEDVEPVRVDPTEELLLRLRML